MRRYPFTVPGLVRLTAGGGVSVVDRLRGAMEPLVMAVVHRFSPDIQVQPVTTDEMNTLDGDEYPREWWVRTSFVTIDAPDATKAREAAWLSIEYTRWEDSEDWAMQAFFRVADVEFSLSTDSSVGEPVLNLLVHSLPRGDIQTIQALLRAHFGGPSQTGDVQFPPSL